MKIKRIAVLFFVFVMSLFALNTTIAHGNDNINFPLRPKYSRLSPITTEELASIYDKAIIVDCRYKMEFHVIRMDRAKSLPEVWMGEDNLLELRQKYDDKPLVFYSNDPSEKESYNAAAKAEKWGFKNIRVYDAGIFHWANNQPQRTFFFKEKLTPQTVASAFISEEQFKSVLLPTREFIERAKSGQYSVLDGREIEKIEKKPIKLENLQIMAIELMANLLRRNIWSLPAANLLVFDGEGENIRWLQYYFELAGIKNYYFLKGGAQQWFADGYDRRGNKK
jgi:rhodanese-related sulfurtransferase